MEPPSQPASATAAVPASGMPSAEDEATVARLRDARQRLKHEIAKLVVGQDRVIDSLLIALLCRGHALMVTKKNIFTV